MPLLSTLLMSALLAVGSGLPSAPPSAGQDMQLARFSWPEAKRLFHKLHPRASGEVEKTWNASRAAGKSDEAARAAAELCSLGNPGGEACREAEKTAGFMARDVTLLRGGGAVGELLGDEPGARLP